MNKENTKLSAPGFDRGTPNESVAQFKEEGPAAGKPVMRLGTEKDWRSASANEDQDKSGNEPTDSAVEAQDEAAKGQKTGETWREGTLKDWRSAEAGDSGEGSPKSPQDQRDAPTMRDGSPSKP